MNKDMHLYEYVVHAYVRVRIGTTDSTCNSGMGVNNSDTGLSSTTVIIELMTTG